MLGPKSKHVGDSKKAKSKA